MNSMVKPKRNKKSRFLSIVGTFFVFALSIFSMLIFSSCKITNSNTDDNTATFDASGKLRVTSPFIDYNKFSKDKEGNKIVDDNSGTFSWDLLYYFKGSDGFDMNNVKDVSFDQIGLFGNFYTDQNCTTPYKFTGVLTRKDVLYKNAGEDGVTSAGWYINDTENGRLTRLYTQAELVVVDSANETNNKTNIAFPDFEVVVDGKYYTFRVNADLSKLKKLSTDELAKKPKNLFKDGSTDGSLFKFLYRTGSVATGGDTFIECPKGMMDYYTGSDGVFKIRFNPNLEEGPTNRYIKVRSIASEGQDRANSIYSSTVAFEAYMLNFEAYSPNSSTLDYGGLEYDKDQYYFAYEKTYYNEATKSNAIKSLVGFFPEGRKVTVSRTSPNNSNYDYAFQSWTTNAKAENSVALEKAFPIDMRTNGLTFNKGSVCLDKALTTGSAAFNCLTSNESVKDTNFLFYEKADEGAQLANLVYDYLTEQNDKNGKLVVTDTLSVVSHRNINNYKFYANYAKVRNFVISGTFFAGDNFFSGQNQLLDGVNIYLSYYQTVGDKTEFVREFLTAPSGSETKPQYKDNSHPKGVTLKRDGAYFTVTGLAHIDCLTFSLEKVETDTEAGGITVRRPYSFHNPLMTDRDFYGSNIKAIDLIKSSTFYTDRQDLGFIGTQYAEQSNLTVNIYQTVEGADDPMKIGDTGLKLLQNGNVSYEVIKSVNSVEDANGYITTNVIISLILPSNATLVGYNVETLNNVSTIFYSDEGKPADGTMPHVRYVSYLAYDPETMSQVMVDINGNKLGTATDESGIVLYEISKSGNITTGVTTTQTREFVEYNGKVYTYHHKSHGGTFTLDGDQNALLEFYISGSSVSANNRTYLIHQTNDKGVEYWFTLSFTKVGLNDKGQNRISVDVKTGTVKVDGKQIVDVSVPSEANEVSTVADAYATNMKHNSIDPTDIPQTVYVYYDIRKYSDATYYASPIAKQNKNLIMDNNVYDKEGEGDESYTDGKVTKDYILYFEEISNFDTLLTDGSIMLGEDIIKTSATNTKTRAFRNMMGSSIILDCYYYIEPLVDKTTLEFKQSIVDEDDFNQTQVLTRLYEQRDSIYQEIEDYSRIGSTDILNDDGETIYDLNFMFINKYGQVITTEGADTDQDVYNIFNPRSGTRKRIHIQSITGHDIKLYMNFYNNTESHDDINTDSFGPEVTDATTGNTYKFADGYGLATIHYGDCSDNTTFGSVINNVTYQIRKEYVLHRVQTDGSITEQRLLFKGGKYYAIVGETASGQVIYSTTEYEIERSLMNKDYFSYEDSIIVTGLKIGNAEQKVVNIYNQQVYYKDGDQYKAESKEFTAYNTFLTINYYKRNTDGSETRYYPAAGNKVTNTPAAIAAGTTGGVDIFYGAGYQLIIQTLPTVLRPQIYRKRVGEVTNLSYSGTGESTVITGGNFRLYTGDTTYTFGTSITDEYRYANNTIYHNGLRSFIVIPDSEGNWYLYGTDTPYYVEQTVEKAIPINTYLYRTAQIQGSNNHVTVLGKYISTNDQDNPTIYPSFSSYNIYTKDEAHIMDLYNGKYNYYSLDYTSKNNVKEGFPGITLLAGLPYPNPVLYLSVRHKASEDPVINLSLNIMNAYYVEVMGTNIQTDDSNLIQDFTTFSFKDTITNLTQNKYIDKTYWVLDKFNYKPVYAYVAATQDQLNAIPQSIRSKIVKVSNGINYIPYIYTVQDNGEPVLVELTIQNIGVNDYDKNIYSSLAVNASGQYTRKLYYIDSVTESMEELTSDNVILWNTSSTTINSAPAYDIHSYYQDKNGIIYFNSGSSFDDNIICNGLHGISSGATNNPNGYYDYTEVMLSGVTYAYRTTVDQLNMTGNMSGYQFDKMVNILNAYDSKDAYFLTGKEAAVIVASPVVTLTDDVGNDYIYRFKEWKIYSRYNSEVLYYNRGLTENSNLIDRYRAIMRFTTDEAGYFVFMPVYERVFTIDLGTAVIEGSLNQGGNINVYYENGNEVDVDGRSDDSLYFAEYEKTVYNNKEGYYYGNLSGYPYLYFTGEFYNSEPVFEQRDDIYASKFKDIFGEEMVSQGIDLDAKLVENIPMFYSYSNNTVTFYKILNKLEYGKPGIVLLENFNGRYDYIYNTYNAGSDTYSEVITNHHFENQGNIILKKDGNIIGSTNATSRVFTPTRHTIGESIGVSFASYFFYDTIGDVQAKIGVSLYYNEAEQSFYTIDVSKLGNPDENLNISDFTILLTAYNLMVNSYLFGPMSELMYNMLGLLVLTTNYKDEDNSPLNNLIDSFNNQPTYSYTVASGAPTEISNSLDKRIAKAILTNFTVLNIFDPVRVNVGDTTMNISQYGNLTAGELAQDENGNVYSTQQFKTSYIDRDSTVMLQAVPMDGYRFEGWYKCEYNKDGNFWVTTDEKLLESEPIYSDEILQAYYNPKYLTYYYITDYRTTERYQKVDDAGNLVYEDDAKTIPVYEDYYIYYFDADKTQRAEVPERMLSKVAGWFINSGTTANPNYVEVYPKNGESHQEFYYEPEFINKVNLENVSVVRLPYVEAINHKTSTLNNLPIYIVKVDTKKIDGVETDVYRYYRQKTTGNIVVEGNKLYIKTLHSNVRYVAKFIETYNEYIFAENEESSGISIEAVYYYNNENTDGHIRSDYNGANRTLTYDESGNTVFLDTPVNSMDKDLFKLYETKEGIFNPTYLNSTFKVKEGDNLVDRPIYNMNYASFNSTFLHSQLGASEQLYSVNKGKNQDGTYVDPTLNGKFNLKTMYFDIHTSVYLVVRVEADYDLTIHSLGVNSSYTITPLLAPDADYVEANRKETQNKVDYLYYIFNITYDRDPENENLAYITHRTRGASFAYDLLSGRYLDFYGEHFNIYDNFDNHITYNFDNGKIRLSDNYLNALFSSLGLEESRKSQMKTWYESFLNGTLKDKNGKVVSYPSTIQEILYKMGEELNDPGCVYCKSVSPQNDIGNYKAGTQYSTQADLYGMITELFKQFYKDAKAEADRNKTEIPSNFPYKVPYLIKTGQLNFVNFSTIPIYNYTVETLTIDSEGDGLTFDEAGRLIFSRNEHDQITLQNSVHTRAGTNGKTYVGNGDLRAERLDYIANHGSYVMSFDEKYINLPFSTFDDNDHHIMQDLPFAQDTILIFDGINKDDTYHTLVDHTLVDGEETKGKYIFAGWYEQKYNKEDETWSDLTLMSREENLPYLSIATADTIIVAIYKRAVDLEFKYNEKEIGVQMNGGFYDSKGKAMNYSKDEQTGEVTLSGRFFFDAKFDLILSPVGGYRFGSFTAQDENGAVNLGAIDYKAYNEANNKFSDSTLDTIILNNILGASFNLNIILRGATNDAANTSSSITLSLNTKKLVNVYLEVQNFTSSGVHSGYDFELRNSSSNAVYFRTNGNTWETPVKDSTNTPVYASNKDGKLVISGYFDYDISGNLIIKRIGEVAGHPFEGWYVNGNPKATSSPDYSSITKSDSEFAITFKYNNDEFNADFDLKDTNTTYFAGAVIGVDDRILVIKHNLYDSLDNLDTISSATTTNSGLNSLLITTGACTSSTGVSVDNAIAATGKESKYTCASTAKISLNADKRFVFANNSGSTCIYVFLGWFYKETETSSDSTLISYNQNILNRNAVGYYEAKYVRAVGLDIEGHEQVSYRVDSFMTVSNIQVDNTITVSGMTNELAVFGELEGVRYKNTDKLHIYEYDENYNIKYVLVGGRVTITLAADTGYRIYDIYGENELGGPIETKWYTISEDEEIANATNIEFLANSDSNHTLFKYGVEEGYKIKLSQTLYNDITMSGSGTPLTATPYLEMSFGKDRDPISTLEEITVNRGAVVTISSLTNRYYFIGLFVNGKNISYDEDSGKFIDNYSFVITEDMVIEARYTLYTSVMVNTYVGSTLTNITNNNASSTVFSFTLTYRDPHTQAERILNQTGTLLQVPSGVTGTLNVTLSASGYPYVFGSISLFNYGSSSRGMVLSRNTLSTITLSSDKATSTAVDGETKFINIGVQLYRVSTIQIIKEIDISSEDEIKYDITSEEFRALFDLILTYQDVNGQTRTINMSSNFIMSDIEIARGSSFTVRPVISPLVNDKYRVTKEDIRLLIGNVFADYTLSSDGLIEVDTKEDDSSVELKVTFSAKKALTLQKELDSFKTNNTDVYIEYELTENAGTPSEKTISGTMSDLAEKTFYLEDGYDYTLTAKHIKDYEFVGWYNNGKLISNKDTLTKKEANGVELSILTARFVKTLTITKFERKIDGALDKTDPELYVKIFGNLYHGEDVSDKDFTVKSFEIAGNSTKGIENIYVQSQGLISLFAGHKAGYKFIGFRVSNGVTSRLVASEKASQGYTALTTLTENCTITAEYETEHNINYALTTLTKEGQTASDGATISNLTTSYSASNKTIYLGLNVKSGFKIKGVYINNEYIEGSNAFINGNNMIHLDKYNEDLFIEVVVEEKVSLMIYLAIDEIADAYTLNNLGVDITKFNIRLNGEDHRFGAYTDTIYGEYGVVVNELQNFVVTYNGSSEFTIGNKAYHFDGYYLYEGNSIPKSASPISASNTISLISSGDIKLVANFTSTKLKTEFETKYNYEFIEDANIAGEMVDSADLTVTDGLTTYNDKTYMFAGYYAKVNDLTNGYRYIKLSSEYATGVSAFDGLYNIITARFIRAYSVNVAINNLDAVKLNLSHATSLFASVNNSFVNYKKTESGYNIYLPASSYAKLDFEAALLYNLSGGIDINEAKLSYEFSSMFENKNVTIETAKTGIDLVVKVVNNRIQANSITLTNAEDSSKIDIANEQTTINISVPENSSSTLHVNTYNTITGEENSFELNKDENSKSIKVDKYSTLSLSYDLAKYEAFLGFEIKDDKTTIITSTSYEYYVPVSAETVTITALFNTDKKTAIIDNDKTKGTASVINAAGYNHYQIIASALTGYEISDILIAEIENGVVKEYSSLLEYNDNKYGFFDNFNLSETYSEEDSFGGKYVTKYDISGDAKKNFAIKPVYKKITKVTFNLITENSDIIKLFKYYNEDTSTLDIAMLEALEQNFRNIIIANGDDSSYTLEGFYYNSKQITSESPVDISGDFEYIIDVNFTENVLVKVNIDAKTVGQYNTPKNGLSVMLAGSVITNIDTVNTISYNLTDGKIISTNDSNGYYTYLGFYTDPADENSLISTSSNIILTRDVLSGLVKEKNEQNRDVYVLYACYEERVQELTVDAEYNGARFVVVSGSNIYFISPALTYLNMGEKGQISYQLDDEGKVVITYPYSLVLDSDSYITIHDVSFSDESTDSLTGKTYYEKQDGDATLRFLSFVDQNGFALSTRYNNEIDIRFADFVAGVDITATATRLYSVEYTYNKVDPSIKITLSMVKLDSNGKVVKTDSISVSGKDLMTDEAILSLLVEEGTMLALDVEFDESLSTEFGGFVINNNSSSKMLSEIFATEAVPTTKDGWKALLNKYGYIPSTRLYDKNDYTSTIYQNGTSSSFNFVVTENKSIIADFYAALGDYRSYIISAVYTPTIGATVNFLNLVDDRWYIVQDQLKFGLGYLFTFDSVGITYNVSTSDSITNKYLEKAFIDGDEAGTKQGFITETIINSNSSNTGSGKFSQWITVATAVQYVATTSSATTRKVPANMLRDAVEIARTQTSISLGFNRYATFEFGAMEIVTNTEESFISYVDNQDLTNSLTSSSTRVVEKYKVSDLSNEDAGVVITAPVRDGYFFKGFLVISNGYEEAYEHMALMGEEIVSAATNYSFIGYTMNTNETTGVVESYSSKPIKYAHDTKVIALYQPTVYVVSIEMFDYKEDAEDKLSHAVIENYLANPDNADYVREYNALKNDSAGYIKGSRLIQGKYAMLSVITHSHAQFAGFTSSLIDDGKINAYYATGKNLRLSDASNYADTSYSTLLYSRLYPNDGNDGKYSSSNYNNIFLRDVDSDITIYSYFVALSYMLNIDIAEVDTTWDYSANNIGGSVSYLAYSDKLTSQPDWKNPSAGEYESDFHNYATNVINDHSASLNLPIVDTELIHFNGKDYTKSYSASNSSNFTTKFTIDDKDPYVYVINDKTGKSLPMPSRVSSAQIAMIDNKFTNTYSNSNTEVRVADENNDNGITASSLKNTYGNDLFMEGYGDTNLNNIYNYMKLDQSGLLSGLFKITVNGEDKIEYNSEDFTISPTKKGISLNRNGNKISVSVKIMAEESSLPEVRVDLNKYQHQELRQTLQEKTIKLLTEREGVVKESAKVESKSISGFNLAVFEDGEKEIDLNDLDVDLVMSWQRLSRPLTIQFQIDGSSKNYTLTDPSNVPKGTKYSDGIADVTGDDCALIPNNLENADLLNKYRNEENNGDTSSLQYLLKNVQEEIASFQVFIVKNANLLLTLLEQINTDSAKEMINMITSAHVGTGSIAGHIQGNSDQSLGHAATGKLLTATKRENIAKLITKYFDPSYLLTPQNSPKYSYYRTLVDNCLTYRSVDVYELYKKGINTNFYNLGFSSSDLILVGCILNEHQDEQLNKQEGFLGLSWNGDRGYAYYRQVKGFQITNSVNGNLYSVGVEYYENPIYASEFQVGTFTYRSPMRYNDHKYVKIFGIPTSKSMEDWPVILGGKWNTLNETLIGDVTINRYVRTCVRPNEFTTNSSSSGGYTIKLVLKSSSRTSAVRTNIFQSASYPMREYECNKVHLGKGTEELGSYGNITHKHSVPAWESIGEFFIPNGLIGYGYDVFVTNYDLRLSYSHPKNIQYGKNGTKIK